MVDEMKSNKELKKMANAAIRRLDKLEDLATGQIETVYEVEEEVIHLEDGIDEIEDEDEREKLQKRIDVLNNFITYTNDSFEIYRQATELAELVSLYVDSVGDKAIDMIKTANNVANYVETCLFRGISKYMPENEQTYLIESLHEMEKIDRDR